MIGKCVNRLSQENRGGKKGKKKQQNGKTSLGFVKVFCHDAAKKLLNKKKE